MLPLKTPQVCPKCGDEAWYSEIFGYINTNSGWRIFCPHCGYHHSSERFYQPPENTQRFSPAP